MTDQSIATIGDMLALLDGLLQDRSGSWWDDFYSDRQKPCPFFVQWPDECLVQYVESGRIQAERVLELGCGNGRNAVYLARQGCIVDAVDFSQRAISWAQEMARDVGVSVSFHCESIFTFQFEPHAYDLVYDAGCFHHIPPHRRPGYLDLVRRALKPIGTFGLVCFTPEGGSGLSDREVYEQRTLEGGLGYSEEQLRNIFSTSFGILELRRMEEKSEDDRLFGEDFLWAALMRLRSSAEQGPSAQVAVGTR